MKNRLKIIIILCVSLALIISGATIFANNDKDTYSVGQKISDIEKNNDKTIIAKVDDKEITKKEFESYKALWSVADTVPSDSDLLDKMIERKVLYSKAMKDGVNVSNEELNKALQEQKDNYANSEVVKSYIGSLIKGLNITEDQYWDRIKEGLVQSLTIGKYKNKLKESFEKDNPNLSGNELQNKFNEYYKNKISEFKNNSKVEKFYK